MVFSILVILIKPERLNCASSVLTWHVRLLLDPGVVTFLGRNGRRNHFCNRII